MSIDFYHAAEDGQRRYIGQSFMSGHFRFWAGCGVQSWREWQDIIAAGGEVQDEVHLPYTFAELARFVERSKRNLPPYWPGQHWDDEDGYSFSGEEEAP